MEAAAPGSAGAAALRPGAAVRSETGRCIPRPRAGYKLGIRSKSDIWEFPTTPKSQRLPVREYLRPAKVANALRRRFFRWRLGKVEAERGVPVRRLGNSYGGWTVPVELVGSDWVVYSLGAGMDVSFETELIAQTGCEVFSFDPTDASARYVAGLEEPRLHFMQVAVWKHDGTLSMYRSPLATSTTLSAANLDVGRATVEVPCRSLRSLTQELGHERVDLLKYHLEGGEYEVFNPELLVELDVKILGIRLFHTASPRTARRLIDAICARGYALVAHESTAFTFLRRDVCRPRQPTEQRARRARPARPRVQRRRRGAPSASVG